MNKPLRILITAGPTYEPIDAVRFLGNRSSGKMGAAIAAAALSAGHHVTAILGPDVVALPADAGIVNVQTADQMHRAVLEQLPKHDVLVMAAAVADFTPLSRVAGKLPRSGRLTLKLRRTVDIVADAASGKRPDQRVVGFALECQGGIARAADKLSRKRLDLIVYNPPATMGAETVHAVLVYPDGRTIDLGTRSKTRFAKALITAIGALYLPPDKSPARTRRPASRPKPR